MSRIIEDERRSPQMASACGGEGSKAMLNFHQSRASPAREAISHLWEYLAGVIHIRWTLEAFFHAGMPAIPSQIERCCAVAKFVLFCYLAMVTIERRMNIRMT